MDNKQKCLYIIAILIAFLGFFYPISPHGIDILDNQIKIDSNINMSSKNITDINTVNITNGIEITNTSIIASEYFVNYTMPGGLTYPYQFEVNISNSTGTNNQTNVYFNGHSNTNFSDVYVIQNSQIIPYCIMDNASIFFNATSSNTLVINYGNKSRVDSQNCAGTFNQYEGINSTAFYADWNTTKLPQIIEANVKTTSATNDIRWGVTNATLLTTYKTYCAIETVSSLNQRQFQCYANGSSVASQVESPSFTNNTLYRLRIDVSPTSVISYVNTDPIGSSTATTALSQKTGLFMYFSAGTGYQSWSFQRTYINYPEPDRNIWGSQQLNLTNGVNTTITHWCVRVNETGGLYTVSGNC